LKTYSKKLKNLEDKYKFLDAFDIPKLKKDNINHINIAIRGKEIEAVIESLAKKILGLSRVTAEFYPGL
jgi:demethoxyubiquinone hydroxylase (CLK1/Coq7/Cat5 family)